MTPLTKKSFIVSTVLASILTSCAGSSSSKPTIPVAADVVVTAEGGLHLDQTSYAASSGEISIAYVNDDTIRHTLVISKDGTKVGGFELKVNQKGDVDFGSANLVPGNYVLLCTVPGHQNMNAGFTVS